MERTGTPIAKLRTAVQREFLRLMDQLAPEQPAGRADATPNTVRRHRSPRRCVLQGETRAVSVVWFPPPPADSSLGEMQVIEWRGEVSIPGSANRSNTGAVAVRETVLHPVAVADDKWAWRRQKGEAPIGTERLAKYCEKLVAAR